jgi:hypothetical protein
MDAKDRKDIGNCLYFMMRRQQTAPYEHRNSEHKAVIEILENMIARYDADHFVKSNTK